MLTSAYMTMAKNKTKRPAGLTNEEWQKIQAMRVGAEPQAKPRGSLRRPEPLAEPKRLVLNPKNYSPIWSDVVKTCSKCDFKGVVALYFGVLKQRGKEHPQSQCANCRSKTNYHLRPRVYQRRAP